MYLVYNFLIILVLILWVIPYYTYRLLTEKGFGRRFRQSLGNVKHSEIEKVARKDCVWIHGASVGEIVATSPLVKQIKKEMPERPILVSAFTVGGYDMAKRIIPEADAVIYFPLDLPFVSESLVKRIQPGVFMPVETELWPNFLRSIRERHIPVMMVNGRISEKSVKTYRYLYSIWDDILKTVTRFCMQSSIDADYIASLGADKNKIFVTGNTKFDQTYAEVTSQDLQRYKKELGLGDVHPVIMAGSTHPGEEKALLKSFKEVRRIYPDARLLIAPRKPARSEEIAAMAEKAGFSVGFRSQMLEHEPAPKAVVMLDTLGELGRLYSVADLVFVGGSLNKTGGHNVLEPAAHAKPVLVGPNMQNFKDSYALLSKVGACRMVKNGEELTGEILRILQDDALREKMGKASFQVICDNRGADVKTIYYLKDLMELNAQPAKKYAEYPVNIRNVYDKDGKVLSHADAAIQYITKLAYGPDMPFSGWLLLTFLRSMSYVYDFAVSTKLTLYKWHIFRRVKLPAFVVSVGNITVGGTGKTPTVFSIVQMMKEKGYKVVVLNRGYKAHWTKDIGVVSDGSKIYMTANEAGDEAFLMAKTLPGVPVIIGKNRSVTGKYAVEHFHAEVIVMDDGYQHWSLQRDLDIVLVDTITMFGNGNVLPRGILREPLRNLDRAHVFLLTKTDQSSVMNKLELREILACYNPRALVAESIHKPKDFVEISNWYNSVDNRIALDELRGKQVLVFSAIGNPASFEQTLSSIGVQLLEAVRYPDHHDYGMSELQYIDERAAELGAVAIVITSKDAVKIPAEFIATARSIPLYVLNMEIEVTKGQQEVEKLFAEMISKTKKLVPKA